MFKKLKFLFLGVSLIMLSVVCASAATFYDSDIASDAVYFVNEETKMVIAEKNANKRRSPASLTKMMNFIVAYENCKNLSSEMVKAPKEILELVDADSSGCKLNADEEMSVLNLMYCMLVCSSGDAAMVLGNYIGNGIDNFVNLMNQKAEQLGCADTHFTNPDGMYDVNQYSTAADVYKIIKYAMTIPLFVDISSTSEYYPFPEGDARNPIITTNKMIDEKRGGGYFSPHVRGGKTGYLEDAGRCLASYAECNGSNYIGVVMGGPTTDEQGNTIDKNMAMIDSKKIYTWAFSHLQTLRLYPAKTPVTEMSLKNVWNTDRILVYPSSDFFVSVPNGVSVDDFYLKYNLPGAIFPPVKPGDIVGTAEVYYKDNKINEFNLTVNETYGKNYLVIFFIMCRSIINSPFFTWLIWILIIIIAVYSHMMIKENKRRRRAKVVRQFPNIKK